MPQPGRQHLFQLGKRTQGGLLDPGDRAVGRGAQQPEGDSEDLMMVEQQRRKLGPGAEPVAGGAWVACTG